MPRMIQVGSWRHEACSLSKEPERLPHLTLPLSLTGTPRRQPGCRTFRQMHSLDCPSHSARQETRPTATCLGGTAPHSTRSPGTAVPPGHERLCSQQNYRISHHLLGIELLEKKR